jgi:uncharacterized protein (DUF1800 family)
LWRAGFGPRPGDLDRLAPMTRRAAVYHLTRPTGAAALTGPQPRISDGSALAPFDLYGHDHLWWLDRMVRSSQPLVERLTLIFHDWFATSNDKVGSQRQMLDQNNLLRRSMLGSFEALFRAITVDPAMLIWLDGTSNQADDVNENYAREMMELFSLGAERGAYTEHDVREQARALTGWTNDYSDQAGAINFRYDGSLHDTGVKTIFGRSGAFTWADAVALCVNHPLHPSFFVTKLWSYFIPVPPDARTVAQLSSVYKRTNFSIRAVVESILLDERFYSGPAMIKPPTVLCAGMLRALGRGIDTEAWVDLGAQLGQQLFYPPNVSGWTKDRWLDTSTYKGRWDAVATALAPSALSPDQPGDARKAGATPAQALRSALRAVGDPPLSSETTAHLLGVARELQSHRPARRVHTMRHNALRQLILSSPDYQTC